MAAGGQPGVESDFPAADSRLAVLVIGGLVMIYLTEWRVRWLRCFLRAASLVALMCDFSLRAAERTGMALMVPAYFYPEVNGEWAAMTAAAARVPVVAIANVNNGPGLDLVPNADYVAAINSLRAAGGRVTGYVYSSYTARPLAQVKADMDRWHALYALDGFFVDEMTNDGVTAHLDYYAALLAHARTLKAAYHVTGNPGINTLVGYANRPCADTFCVFETPSGYPGYIPDPWNVTVPTERLLHLMYNVSSAATMQSYLNLALARRAGYVYVTDDSGGNPWDRLPTYWQAEVTAIELINRTAAIACPPVIQGASVTGNILRLTVRAPVGNYALETSSNLAHWTADPSTRTFAGVFMIERALTAPLSRQFFRVRSK